MARFHNIRKQQIQICFAFLGKHLCISFNPLGRWRWPLYYGGWNRLYKGDTSVHFYIGPFNIWHHCIGTDFLSLEINFDPNNFWWDDLTKPRTQHCKITAVKEE